MNKEKQIEEIAKILASNCGDCGECEYYRKDIDGIDSCYHKYADMIYIAGYRKQSEPISCGHENGCEWISVNDMMPEDMYGKYRKKITVLVCTESGRVSTASRQRAFRFDKTKLEWVELDTFEWNNRKCVTHWMPLPEPPKGE